MQDDQQYWEFDFLDGTTTWQGNRRQFLATAGGGIFLLFTIGDLAVFLPEGQARAAPDMPSDFNAYLKIGEDGRVTCFTGKVEMGQGAITALAQMLADELDVAPDAVDMLMGDTDLCPYDRGTVGSQSIRSFGPPLRAAGAQARRVLLELAAERLKAPVKNMATENGLVFDSTNRQSCISYAQLAQGQKIVRQLKEKAAIKKPSEFKIIGKPFLRRDAGEKVTGRAKYTGDIQLPGMLAAKILRPPAHGAKLMEVDVSAARKVPGVEVVREGDFIAVLHKYPDVAAEALAKIKAKFDMPASGIDDNNIFDHLLKVASKGQVVTKGGDLQNGAKEAKEILEATYLDGYVAHAAIEPHTAVARVEGDKATVWVSTQAPFRDKEAVANALAMAPENVRVITPFVGGGFGGKSRNQQAVEAARIAKLCGKPVQLAWSRKEEFFYDTFRPAAVVKIKSGITSKGKISFWDYHVYFAGERGAAQFYDVPHHSTMSYGARGDSAADNAHPFGTGAWRAPGNNTNTFARESHIDSLAVKAGMDPFEFRMQNLADRKMQRVLKTAAEKFGWKPAKAPSGRGYGIACGIDAGAYVATMAEVHVEKATGHVQVKRLVCVQDMGLAINPEGATLQMEGCMTMGLGYALKEHIRFKNGEIFDLNFDTYDIPRFSWLPKIETIIIDDKEAVPQGGGEPAIVTMGGVIANAIYDAVGVRLFQLPLSPERIKEAARAI
jgi:nicotinate dehydrogenase subunit B